MCPVSILRALEISHLAMVMLLLHAETRSEGCINFHEDPQALV